MEASATTEIEECANEDDAFVAVRIKDGEDDAPSPPIIKSKDIGTEDGADATDGAPCPPIKEGIFGCGGGCINVGGEEDVTLATRSNSEVGPSSSTDEQSRSYCRRICCCFANCTYPKMFTIIIHSAIMLLALLCFVPTGAMVSKVRAHWGGLATLVWIIYCCVMIISNVVYYVRRRRGHNHTDQGKRNCQEEEDVDVDDNDADIEDQADESHLISSCNEMGCLCFADRTSSTDKSTCCWKKVPCHVAIVILLIIEGVLLLTPVLAPTSTYKSIDVAIKNAFPEEYLAPDPKNTPFSFGKYLFPGGFSMSGGYTNAGKFKTFKYKEGCVPECELDIHTPDGDIPRPVIFEVHGGGWDSGVKSDPKIPISYWLERGYAFVSIQYRFPSQTPGGSTIWEQLDDVEDAFNYMMDIGAENGLDTSRVLVTGDSAGGHLACVVAYRSESPAIKGVMNFYGATEWKYYFDTGGKLLNHLLGKLLPGGGTDEDYTAASCSTYATSSSPPLLTIHGTWDVLVPIRLSSYLHSVVDNLGVPNLLVEIPLSDHVLELGFHSIGGQPSLYAMERFAAAQLLGS